MTPFLGVNAFVATYTNANSVVSTQAFVITGQTYSQFFFRPDGAQMGIYSGGGKTATDTTAPR